MAVAVPHAEQLRIVSACRQPRERLIAVVRDIDRIGGIEAGYGSAIYIDAGHSIVSRGQDKGLVESYI